MCHGRKPGGPASARSGRRAGAPLSSMTEAQRYCLDVLRFNRYVQQQEATADTKLLADAGPWDQRLALRGRGARQIGAHEKQPDIITFNPV